MLSQNSSDRAIGGDSHNFVPTLQLDKVTAYHRWWQFALDGDGHSMRWRPVVKIESTRTHRPIQFHLGVG